LTSFRQSSVGLFIFIQIPYGYQFLWRKVEFADKFEVTKVANVRINNMRQ
jgi:hypothetical protein